MSDKHHCYFIPFSVRYDEEEDINDIELLLGRKVLYSDQQGFFMSNPKQWIASGGMCGLRSERDKMSGDKKASMEKAIGEFVEETGLDFINLEDKDRFMFNYVSPRSSKYSYEFFFFEVSDKEYKKMDKINRKKADMYFYELDTIKWVPLNIALSLMDDGNKYNKYTATMTDAVSYLKDLKERHNLWRLKDMEFRGKLQKFFRMNIDRAPERYFNDLVNMYIDRGDELPRRHISFFKDFINYLISSDSYTDWYYEGMMAFKEFLEDEGVDVRFMSSLKYNEESEFLESLMDYSNSRIKIPTDIEDVIKIKNMRNESYSITDQQRKQMSGESQEKQRWKPRREDISKSMLPSRRQERRNDSRPRERKTKNSRFASLMD